MVLAAAEREGLEIDYLARESACADADGISPATLTLGSLVTEPVPGATGGRPPLTETGWLTNGQRSPSTLTGRGDDQARVVAAAAGERATTALYLHRRRALDEPDGRRTWSCPMLAPSGS